VTAPVQRTGGGVRVVAAAVVGFVLLAVAGALVVELRPTTYRSLALISLDQPSVLTTADDPSGIAKLSRLREAYGPLLETSSLAAPIAQETGLTEEQVADRLQALVPKDSLLLGVRGVGPTPGAAQNLTEAAADEIVSYAADQQQAGGVKAEDRVVLSVVSPARPGVRATGGLRTLVTVAGFLGLLGAAVGVALTGFRAPREEAPGA
jgi:hypothetical protein